MAEKKTEIQVFDGGVTEEQVKLWKGQHRKVARIEVEDDGESMSVTSNAQAWR